jgi:hypothetical protein
MPTQPTGERPYRSRKQKPCDKCRSRKIFCARHGGHACVLCRTRGLPCIVDGVVLAEGEDRSTRAVSSPYHGHSPADYGDSTPPKGPDEAVQASSVRIERFIGLSSDLDPYILRHKAWSPVQARREAQWSCHRYSKDALTPAHFEVGSCCLEMEMLTHSRWCSSINRA